MKIEKMLQAALGVYLILPGPEDPALIPSAVLGAVLIADAFGVKL